MKKQIAMLTILSVFVTSGMAINVLDISLEPDTPRHGDNVNVTAYVDGEKVEINSVDVDVREDGVLIAEDVALTKVSGDNNNVAGYNVDDAFTVNSDDTQEFNYQLNVQAIDKNGNEDSRLLNLEVTENETIIEEEPVEQDASQVKFFGLKVIDWLIIFGIILFTWTLFKD